MESYKDVKSDSRYSATSATTRDGSTTVGAQRKRQICAKAATALWIMSSMLSLAVTVLWLYGSIASAAVVLDRRAVEASSIINDRVTLSSVHGQLAASLERVRESGVIPDGPSPPQSRPWRSWSAVSPATDGRGIWHHLFDGKFEVRRAFTITPAVPPKGAFAMSGDGYTLSAVSTNSVELGAPCWAIITGAPFLAFPAALYSVRRCRCR